VAAPGHATATAAAGFTHHQILALAAPFLRAGLQLDLSASDRRARCLQFQPVQLAAGATLPALCETWRLASPRPGWYGLRRCLRLAGGLNATLEADGAQPAELLARLQAVSAEGLFRCAARFCIARSFRCEGGRLLPTAARLQAAGFTLDARLPCSLSSSATLTLGSSDGRALVLPADLLAVLGWRWSMLRAASGRWQGSLRLRGRREARAAELCRQLEVAAPHLLRTLGEPPPCFHERLLAARLGVVLRLSLPWLAAAGLGLDLLLAGQLQQARHSAGTALLLALPPALLLCALWRSEQAHLEWPRWPRRPAAADWHA